MLLNIELLPDKPLFPEEDVAAPAPPAPTVIV
jgi:hypothetical protein